VDGVEAESHEFAGGTPRQSLIEKELHALFGSASTLSSSAAAA
jgi:hypothetical protein